MGYSPENDGACTQTIHNILSCVYIYIHIYTSSLRIPLLMDVYVACGFHVLAIVQIVLQ